MAVYGRSGIVPEPVVALRELRFLIATIPKDLKTKIKPIENKLVDEIAEKADTYYKARDSDSIPSEKIRKLYSAYQYKSYYAVSKLVDELSTFLHEYQITEQ